MLTHLDRILDCFARMDRTGLEDLLSPDFTYNEVSKDNFLDRLEDFWKDWRKKESYFDALEVIPGSCCNKACQNHLGKTAYQFRSPDGKSLDLRFVLEQDVQGNFIVKDIYPCHDLLTFERIEGPNSQLTFWVYEDDKRGTELSENYPILLHQAQEGLANWKELIAQGPFHVTQLHDWLRDYENAYQDCGEWIDLGDTVWRWDAFLQTYHDVELFVSFVEEFETDLIGFQVGDYVALTEEQLLPLILDIERRMELRYTVIHGTDFNMTDRTDFGELCINCRTSLTLRGDLIRVLMDFRSWFTQVRSRLLSKYFSLTNGERDAFLETAESPFQLYQVGTMLSFHLQTRERFRKQGVFIPYNLGGELNANAPN
uniref:hypothetical protein n=1 Tax=Algoriphagus sp. TaxID=1872435 RepID=UPI004047BAB6